MTRIDVAYTKAPSTLTTSPLYSSPVVNVSHHPRPRPYDFKGINGLNIRPESIVIITSILLSGLLAMTIVVIFLTIAYRKRRNKEKGKLKLKLPPIQLEKDYDNIDGVNEENVDVIFDKKQFKKCSKKRKSSSKKGSRRSKCRVCLDRGHKICQGHSRQSLNNSVTPTERKHLNFLEPCGFYEHIKVQTEHEVPDVHQYTQLEDKNISDASKPQPQPRQVVQMSAEQPSYYTNLHELSSGESRLRRQKGVEHTGNEYEYSEPIHYEEVANYGAIQCATSNNVDYISSQLDNGLSVKAEQEPDHAYYENVTSATTKY